MNNTMLDADLVAIIADYPQSFTWNSTAYACAADDLTTGREADVPGVYGDEDVALHVRTTLFTGGRPVAGSKLTYASKTLRVVSVRAGPDDLMLTLGCEEVTA